MKKLWFILLTFALILCIASCGGEKAPSDNGETDDSGIKSNTPVVSEEDALPYENYCIVRSDTAGDAIKNASVEIRKAIMKKTGEMPDLITDWQGKGNLSEIVVGNSKRGKAEDYKLKEYRIFYKDGDIFILGGSDDAVVDGTNYFIEHMLGEKGLLLCEGFIYVSGSGDSVDAIKAGDKYITKAYIKEDTYGGQYARRLKAKLQDELSMEATLSDSESLQNILFVESHELVDDDKWGIVGENGKIYFVAKNDLEFKAAYEAFVKKFSETKGDLVIDGLFLTDHQRTKEEYYASAEKELVIYPEFPEQIRRIYDYDVSVTFDGKTEKIPVYNHVVESNVSRRDGADMYRRFSMFAFVGGQARVDIKVKQDFTSYTVFPSAKNFKSEFKDGVISVYLDKPEYFGIQLDDDQNTILSVFADYPEFPDEVPDKDDPDTILIDGWYENETGLFDVLEDYKTVYLTPGSVLNCRVKVAGKHCRVLGRGAIVDPFQNIYEKDIRDGGTEGSGYSMLSLSGYYITVDGVVLLDARCFNYILGGKKNSITNCKALAAMMTTDGITSWGGDVSATNCYLYVGDNAITCSTKNGIYKDITIGTTCAALFPQGSPDNCLFEDINVFRSDDGIITYRYNPQKEDGTWNEQTCNITIRRLNAVELPTSASGATRGTAHFFQGANMGKKDKFITFEDISVVGITKSIDFRNDASKDCPTENFTLTFKNYNENEKTLKSYEELVINNPAKSDNTVKVTDEGNFTPVKRNIKTVNYSAKNKVYIGSRQVFLSVDPKTEGGKKMLKADEICALLRVKNPGKGEYLSADDLKSLGLVESVNSRQDSLYLAPIYKGANMFLPDEGVISYFAENTCYCLDLVVTEDRDGKIYNVYSNPKQKSADAGISRLITDEVRMYGEGKYNLKFSAKTPGGGTEKVVLSLDRQNKEFTFGVGEDWTNISIDFEIGADAMTAKKVVLIFRSNTTVLDEFSFRDFSLTKID